MTLISQALMFFKSSIHFCRSDKCTNNIVKSCTGLSSSMSLRLSKHSEEDGLNGEGIPLRRQESLRSSV